ncbi:MAG: hypothetical protein U0V48_02760 [Anaerolineales bacterium]
MNDKRTKDALENIARRGVPEDVNLMPRIAARLERRSLMMTIRTRPLAAILIALLTLLILTGVAYAIGKAMGYIPGIGLVDQSVPLRVLAEPVIVTRDGITLTVEQVVLSADKTVLVYKVDGIPSDAFVGEESGDGNSSVSSISVNVEGTPEVAYANGGNAAQCIADERILLPDGSTLHVNGGEGNGWLSGFERRFEYGPVPTEINEAVFVISCIDGTAPGRLPENWEIQLMFEPAPPEMTVLPLVEVTSPSSNASPSAITVDRVVETEDGYILYGNFRLIGYPSNMAPSIDWIKFTDANGKNVEASPASNVPFEYKLDGPYPWTYEIKGKHHAFPLTLSIDFALANVLGETTEFEFDAGTDPQVGQTWTLKPEVQLDGHDIKEVVINRTNNGYEFRFQVDPDLILFGVEINGFQTSRGNGGSDGFGGGKIYQSLEYEGVLPSGKLVVRLIDPQVTIYGPWQAQWNPEETKSSLYEISLYVDQFISLDDGYYLIGHTEWGDDRIANVNLGGWTLAAFDSSGRELPIEPAIYGSDLVSQNLQPGQWAYHLYGKNFIAPLTLRVSQIGVEFKQPVRFNLDLPSNDFDFSDRYLGKTWQLDSSLLDVPGIQASVSTVKYVKEGDLRGFELNIQSDPALQGLEFSFESGLVTEGMTGIASGGGSNRDETSNMILSHVLANAPMQFPLVLSAAHAQINGTWEATWNPPVDTSGSQPVYLEQPRLDLNLWKQIASHADSIPFPVELTGKLLIARGALAPEPSLFLSNLDGSEERGLVFGHGAISPDGAKLVYSDENGIFKLMDIATGNTTILNVPQGSIVNISWSPNGDQIAFDRATDTFHAYIMNANGENLRQLTFGSEAAFVRGWSGDGSQILVAISKDSVNYMLQLVNVETAMTTNLFMTQSEQASISPNGEWIAYVNKVNGKMGGGIYVSRLDGSERRLFVQLDHWVVSNPIWSPDSQWLAFSILNTDQFDQENPKIAAISANLDWQWIISLPKVDGQPLTWITP